MKFLYVFFQGFNSVLSVEKINFKTLNAVVVIKMQYDFLKASKRYIPLNPYPYKHFNNYENNFLDWEQTCIYV